MTTGFCKQLCGFYHWADLFDMSIRAVAFDGCPPCRKLVMKRKFFQVGVLLGLTFLDWMD